MTKVVSLVLTMSALGLAGCSGDDIDWREEGRGIGRGLQQEGNAVTAEACATAIRAYVRDVGLPSSESGLSAMQQGCQDQ